LEDDWRRRSKTNPLSDALADLRESETDNNFPENEIDAEEDSTETSAELSSDPYDPQFYLQQIPVTEEEIAASNLIISDGMFNMAVVYKDGLEDANLALETFDELDTRFPDHENKLQAYHHIYLIYLKEGNKTMADLYKQKIRATFPDNELAIAMADPNYEYNLKMWDVLVDSLYQDTYQAYLDGDVNRMHLNYAMASQTFGTSKLMPKFLFLHALSYVQTNDAEQFKAQLKELISKYPDADVAVLASEMMKGFQRGLILSASGNNLLARGGLFNIHFGSEEDSEALDSIRFSPDIAIPHQLLIIYPQGNLDDNLLLYTVASFNFGNFILTDFDLERTTMKNISLLQIKGFNSLAEVMQYVQMIYAPEGYAEGLEQSAVVVPISLENYTRLMQGKTLESYMQFFEENFGQENPLLIERWKAAQEQESAEEISSETSTEPESTESSFSDLKDFQDTKDIPTQQPDTISTEPPTIYDLERQKTDELAARTEDLLNQGSRLVEDLNTTLNEIAADPIRGLQKLLKNLFTKKSTNAIDAYAKEQEKAEKERQKQLKQEKAETDKTIRAEALQTEKERQALLKKQADEEKALLAAKKKREAEITKLKKQEEKAKADEKKRLQKEKDDARKKKAKERLDAQKQKEKERKAKEKARQAERKKQTKGKK